LPYIFDTFRQEDAATTRGQEGLGLGLTIVKRLVEMHGGSVVARSAGERQGATFVVELPLLAETMNEEGNTPLEQPSATPLDAKTLRGLRVLVVDDDADARLIVRRLLTDYGCVVTVATTAAEALALLPRSDSQILVSDIGMPTQDGYYLIEQVRAAGYTAEKLPAIALTAFARTEDRARLLASGFQDHLPKPIDLEMLLGTIARLMRCTHP